MKEDKIQRIAEKWMIKSNHPNYVYAAILVGSGSRIISIGINRISPKPFYVLNGKGNISLHAEVDCLHMIDRTVSQGATLYIYGRSKAGNYICTKPCISCEPHLRKMGIKRVFYQEVDGSLTCLKIK